MKINPETNMRPNRLHSALMSNHSSSRNEGQSFTLKSSREYAVRSQRVFQALETLEREHETRNSQEGEKDEESSVAATDNFDAAPFPFLKPKNLVHRRKKQWKMRVPDYMKHPEKWKKYSLLDVPDHTDEANTSAAMQFLGSLKKKHSRESSQSDLESSQSDVLFQKPVSSNLQPVDDETTKHTSFSSQGHITMPECVVGLKKRVVQKKKAKIVQSETKVQLQHLQESEDDEP